MIAFIWLEVLLLTMAAFYPIARSYRRNNSVDIFDPIYLLLSLFWIVSAGRAVMLIMVDFQTPYLVAVRDTESWIALGLFWFLVAIVSIEIGYYSVPSRSFFSMKLRDYDNSEYRVVLFSLLALSLAGALTKYSYTGGSAGIDFLLADAIQFRGVFWMTMVQQAYFAALTFSFALWLISKKTMYLILFCLAGFAVLFEEMGLGSKGGIIGPILMLAVCYHYLYCRLGVRTLGLLTLFVLFFVPVTYLFREYGFDWATILEQAKVTDFSIGSMLMDFMNRWYDLDLFAVVLQSLASGAEPLYWFGVVTDFFVQLVPSALWPDKPVGYSIKLLQTFVPGLHSELTGGTISFPGTLYYSFSWAGVPIGSFFFGKLVSLCRNRLQRQRDVYHITAYALFLYCMARYPQGLLPEATIALIGRTGPFIVLIFAMRLIRHSRRKHRSIMPNLRMSLNE